MSNPDEIPALRLFGVVAEALMFEKLSPDTGGIKEADGLGRFLKSESRYSSLKGTLVLGLLWGLALCCTPKCADWRC